MVERPVGDSQAPVDALLAHLPTRLRPGVERMLEHWPGRMLWGTVAAFVRVELFDRSMAIAAQFFTSVFPTVIMLGALFGGGQRLLSDSIDLPAQSRILLEDAFSQSSAAFGILGTLIVLASATSLSRALARAYAAIWSLPRPRARLS
jgi:membrane protein